MKLTAWLDLKLWNVWRLLGNWDFLCLSSCHFPLLAEQGFLPFYCCSITVVLIFPLYSPLCYPPPPPTFNPPPPIDFVRGFFIHVPWLDPSSIISLPSGYCHFVLYFHFSGSILLACLFCWLSSTCKWDMSFTTWLISLSKCSPILSMLLRRVRIPSLFLFHSIPLCECTTGFWSTHILIST